MTSELSFKFNSINCTVQLFHFVYYNWGSTTFIYRPLPYPVKSLVPMIKFISTFYIIMCNINLMAKRVFLPHFFAGREWTLDLNLFWLPKILIIMFSHSLAKKLEDFYEIKPIFSKLSHQSFQYTEGIILSNFIEDVLINSRLSYPLRSMLHFLDGIFHLVFSVA